jgi:hypothetical protein
MIALEDLPTIAVTEACRRWLCHEAGTIDGKQPNYEYAPVPPTLRVIALQVAAELNGQARQLERLLSAEIAEQVAENSAPTEKLSSQIQELMSRVANRVRMPGAAQTAAHAGGDGKHALRVAADLERRKAARQAGAHRPATPGNAESSK